MISRSVAQPKQPAAAIGEPLGGALLCRRTRAKNTIPPK
jgi:hypothetical protein